LLGTAIAFVDSMGSFKKDRHRDERPKRDVSPETIHPAPWLGQVGDGATLESGERIARELRELAELRRHADVDKSAHMSADPEMPIPDVESDTGKR
jgi:hypothetical protein